MWLRWFPWRYIVRRVARARGFIDPVTVLAQLHRFAQPSEVGAPLELLRAGVVFHARGLMNTGAIQHNLDWVWPYWVERQFDPLDDAFIPRAFSITHVNLTHRNWTAVGLPDFDHYPLVDPRGLVTPFWDRWSVDAWIMSEDGPHLIPSRAAKASQRLEMTDGLAVMTQTAEHGLALTTRTTVDAGAETTLRTTIEGQADRAAWLAIVLRPYNPEGVSFVHEIKQLANHSGWQVDEQGCVELSEPGERRRMSDYRRGDVFAGLPSSDDREQVTCDVGMATAAALYELRPYAARRIEFRVPLDRHHAETKQPAAHAYATGTWPEALGGVCHCELPDEKWQFLFDAAVRTLILHSPGDVYPGPYTYKRFWFRDAAFILHGLLCAGLQRRVERVLDHFPGRQTRAGYYLSQEGEWDSNGAALWILWRYCQLANQQPKPEWRTSIERGAQWIIDKRTGDQIDAPHAGLLPAGFSAEHLGPNDFYYWDDFWGVAGLRAAADLVEPYSGSHLAGRFRHAADSLSGAIERSLTVTADRRSLPGIPASPYRRMDPGAIGSLVVGYPLQLWPADEPRLLATADFLQEHCFVRGGFFQDMIHSGINAYLTLHVAQVLLRAGDARCAKLAQAVADLASPTGQWPEAIHPRTLGGCMGDGQHVWAAAEWLLYVRNAFVREEQDCLVLGGGIPVAWLEGGQPCSLGPTPTPFGEVTVNIRPLREEVEIEWSASWRAKPPRIEVRLPGFAATRVADGHSQVAIPRSPGGLLMIRG